MKILIFILLFLVSDPAIAQRLDSSDYNVNSDPRIGKLLPDISLRDTAGKKVKLSSFKGKTIYLDFWSTTCTPCIKLFPYEDSLSDRLKKAGLDTNILIVKICGDSPLDEWKSMIKKQHGNVVNLILPGKAYKLFRRYKIPYYATYYLIDSDFKYLGTDVFRPDDPNIDYYLFRATHKISFIDAVKELKQFQNGIDVPVWYLEWEKLRKP